MAVTAYLNFRGNTNEVLAFYQEALDGTDLFVMKMGELPSDPNHVLSDNDKNLIANASMKFAGGMLMFSDIPDFMAENFTVGNNVSLSIVIDNKAELTRYYSNLKEGGTIIMPLAEVPWSELYGNVIDKFGIQWQFNYSQDDYYKN